MSPAAPLILALVSPAFAARVYWSAPPDDEASAAVARAVPGAVSAPLDTLGGLTRVGTNDTAALETLRAELAACRPLTDVFDGELQIMARLSKATSDVTLLPSAADRALLFEALVFEGAAAHRYFQDKLGTEPLAAPYRVGTGPDAQVRPWLEAAALLDAPTPSEELLSEPADRNAYDAVQAYVKVMPSVSFAVGALAEGAEVYVDGQKVDGGAGARVLVAPGRHLAHVRVGDTLLLRVDRSFEAGSTFAVEAPYGPTEAGTLRALVESRHDGWAVPSGALAVIAKAAEPTYVAVPGDKGPSLYRVDSGKAVSVAIPREVTSTDGLYAEAGAGVGWASTGDWFLQNAAAGAPYERSTVNAVTPAATVHLGYRRGLLMVGVGGDLVVTPGAWHSLPTGDKHLQAWAGGYGYVGVPWVQATIGLEAPWYLALGGQADIPLAGPLGLYARATYGYGLTRDRGDDPAFEPLPAFSAWGGLRLRLGGRPM